MKTPATEPGSVLLGEDEQSLIRALLENWLLGLYDSAAALREGLPAPYELEPQIAQKIMEAELLLARLEAAAR